MDKLKFIYDRKSIRDFKNEEVSKNDILKLLKAATYAPSPKNQQNWHFVVIENKDIIKKMAQIVEESHKKIANMAKTDEERTKYMKLLKYYTLFDKAPVVIVVYGEEYDMIEYKILKDNGADEHTLEEILSSHSEVQGIGAAVENFLLGATAMGYGTCYMTGPTHARKELEELIGFTKEGYSLMSMIAMGVPEDKEHRQPPRKPLEDVVTFIS